MTKHTGNEGLLLAIEAAGTQAELARLLGITRGAIAHWLRLGYVPVQRCVQIERVTGISRRRLRPDVFDEQAAA